MTVKEDTQALSRAQGTLHADGVQTGTSPERGTSNTGQTHQLPSLHGPPLGNLVPVSGHPLLGLVERMCTVEDERSLR